MAHRQRPGDRLEVTTALPRPEGRGAGGDAHPLDAHQRVHDLLGHPLAEILLVLVRAHVREGQHGDCHGRGVARGRPGRPIVRRPAVVAAPPRRDRQPRLAEAIDQLLDELGQVPLPELVARDRRKVGSQAQQLSHVLARRLALSELAVDGREERVRVVLPRHEGLGGEGSRALVVATAICVEEGERPVPRRVVWVEQPRPLSQLAAPLPVSGEGQQVGQVLDRGSVQGVEGEGSLGGAPKGVELLPEVVSLGQGEMRDVALGRGLHRTPRGLERAAERVGEGVEAEPVLLPVEHRQHGPGRVTRRFFDGPLEDRPCRGVLLGRDARVVAERAQQRLVRTELVDGLAPHRLAHAAGQDSVPVGDRGDDPGNEIVLQLEDRVGVEGAVVGLRPQVGAGACVHQLNGDAQCRARLANAALHHVAGSSSWPTERTSSPSPE